MWPREEGKSGDKGGVFGSWYWSLPLGGNRLREGMGTVTNTGLPRLLSGSPWLSEVGLGVGTTPLAPLQMACPIPKAIQTVL